MQSRRSCRTTCPHQQAGGGRLLALAPTPRALCVTGSPRPAPARRPQKEGPAAPNFGACQLRRCPRAAARRLAARRRSASPAAPAPWALRQQQCWPPPARASAVGVLRHTQSAACSRLARCNKGCRWWACQEHAANGKRMSGEGALQAAVSERGARRWQCWGRVKGGKVPGVAVADALPRLAEPVGREQRCCVCGGGGR